jgi:serine/threonine protein kinase
MRAVKVVRREDFEMDRTFEREFDGILKFEPISRNHPGLVDIMELGDDRERGLRINPVDYEPRTLATDKAAKKRFTVDETVEVGVQVAASLQFLHDRGLAHRDIKPSNIIFVDGQPKLADVGLVAETGQQTYVGTEGFVPPEGPGSPSADIYSLGMVLYELSTGQDRLQFPELPPDAGLQERSVDRSRRRMLNEAICQACHPNSKKRFATAKHLIEALRSVRKGKYKRPILPRAIALFVLSSGVGFGLAWAKTGLPPWPPGQAVVSLGPNPVNPPLSLAPTPPPPSTGVKLPPPPVIEGPGSLVLRTIPDGAEVFLEPGHKSLGKTPLTLPDVPVGKKEYRFELNEHETETLVVMVRSGQNPLDPVKLRLQPPVEGRPWVNGLGMKFLAQNSWHISANPVGYEEFEKLTKITPSDVENSKYARVTRADAQAFCDVLLKMDREQGRLDENHIYEPKSLHEAPQSEPAPEIAVVTPIPDEKKDEIMAFKCLLRKKEYAKFVIESDPPGASIYLGGQMIGQTPKIMDSQPIGPVEVRMVMVGYEDFLVSHMVKHKQTNTLKGELEKSRKARLGADYENTLGMKFRPVEGTETMFCIWETRVRDYDAYLATLIQKYADEFGSGPDHPVAVTRDDATLFCEWLTTLERGQGLLSSELEYRLPTDEEWSLAANLHERALPDPSSRNQTHKNNWIWGFGEAAWPPPREPGSRPGNFSDKSRLKGERDGKVVIGGYADGEPYDDGFPYSAPVGQFPANKFGLFDLAGNVAEWVSDAFGGPELLARHGVVRGGSWSDGKPGDLLSSARNAVRANRTPEGIYGFRCVLAKVRPIPKAKALPE